MNGIRAGYLIVKTYERMYQEFDSPAQHDQIIYGIPRRGIAPDRSIKKYLGIARDPLGAWHEELRGSPGVEEPEEEKASLAITELERLGKSEDDFIFSPVDAYNVLRLLYQPNKWQLIWATDIKAAASKPEGSSLLGFEPAWFAGDHFSVIADCMFFPCWHGTDKEGKLFLSHFEKLNNNGLFNSAKEAEEFLSFYRSHDWTETGDYVIAETMQVSQST